MAQAPDLDQVVSSFYCDLLYKYMQLVRECEGVSFVDQASTEEWCGISPFTKEEIEVLRAIDKQIDMENK